MPAMLAAILGGMVRNKGNGNAMEHGPGEWKRPRRKSSHWLNRSIAEDFHRRIKNDSGQIQVSMQSRGLVVSFNQAALFPSGEDVISPEA